jgi:hypothetical protein
VRFFDKGTNMHRPWDSDMIERVGDTEDFWLAGLAALVTPEARAIVMKGTVEDWATDSLLAARQDRHVPETGNRLKPGQKLGGCESLRCDEVGADASDWLCAKLPGPRWSSVRSFSGICDRAGCGNA